MTVKQSPPDITRANVTPLLAAKWLESNTKNPRPLVSRYVDIYASDMKHGRWAECSDPICFRDGKLVNGQHRLNAVIKSGVTVPLYVCYNWPSHVFDVGRARCAGTVFQIEGIQNGGRIASLTGLIASTKGGLTVIDRVIKHSAGELMGMYSEDKERIDMAVDHTWWVTKSGCDLAAWMLISVGVDLSSIRAFFKDLRIGNGLQGHPLRELNKQMLAEKHLFKAAVGTHAIITAWNKVAKCEKAKKFDVAIVGSLLPSPISATYEEMK
jgi:hypothetical protein